MREGFEVGEGSAGDCGRGRGWLMEIFCEVGPHERSVVGAGGRKLRDGRGG